MPKLSIIIAAFNTEKYIEETLKSVLSQPFSDFEVIVVDDGSTDESAKIVQAINDERIQYVYQENQGQSPARERGFREASGIYILFLDSDDLYLPGKLGLQVEYLDEHPDVDLVASGYQYIDARGNFLREEKPWLGEEQITTLSLLRRGLTVIHAVTMRRESFEKSGGFDARFRGPEDMDLWFRLGLQGCRMAWLKEVVCQYRIHATSTSFQVERHHAHYVQVLDNFFAHKNVPKEIEDEKKYIYMRCNLSFAGRHYGVGNVDEGKILLEETIRQNPDEFNPRVSIKVLDIIVGWERLVFVSNPMNFWSSVLQHLPENLQNQSIFARDLSLHLAKYRFYGGYNRNEFTQVKKQWWKIFILEPNWVFNRGGWSILLQAYGVKKKPVNE